MWSGRVPRGKWKDFFCLTSPSLVHEKEIGVISLPTFNYSVGKAILLSKGNDYTEGGERGDDSEDRLWNFKEVAKRFGLTPLQVWAVYWTKHNNAIEKLRYALPSPKGKTGRVWINDSQ